MMIMMHKHDTYADGCPVTRKFSEHFTCSVCGKEFVKSGVQLSSYKARLRIGVVKQPCCSQSCAAQVAIKALKAKNLAKNGLS